MNSLCQNLGGNVESELKQFSLIQERCPDKSCWERFVLLSNCFMKHFSFFSFSNLSVLLMLDHKPCNLREILRKETFQHPHKPIFTLLVLENKFSYALTT